MAALRAHGRTVTKSHCAPFASIQCKNARGFVLLFANGEGGGEKGEGEGGIWGFGYGGDCAFKVSTVV